MGKRLPNQGDVDSYLSAVPGQAASVTGFTNFLNRLYATTLTPRVDKKRARKQRKEQLARTMTKMAKCTEQSEEWRERWIVTAMEYFHGKKVSKRTLRQQTIELSGDGVRLHMEGATYWLPIT